MKPQVEIYDTTLRDGSQGEGINFSVADKLRIAEKLDAFGVHYIEGGWPGSNPKDIEFFAQARKKKFKNARLAAFGSTRKKGVPVEQDDQVRLLIEAATPVVTIFGKTSMLHVKEVLRCTPEENLAMIGDTVKFLKDHGKFVIYDAEHCFDGYKLDPEYALATWQAAEKAGADFVVLCDTNGGCLPGEVAAITKIALGKLNCQVGIHTHDDIGLGVANALAALRRRRGSCPGHHQRLRRAHRQLQSDQRDSLHRAEDEKNLRAGEIAAQIEGAFAVRGRNREPAPQPAPAVGRLRRVCAQGRHARQRRPETFIELRAH